MGVTLAAPYYDDRVIEAGLAVRPQERITPWRYKPLIIEAMRGIVPGESLTRQTKANGSGDEDPGLRRHRAELLALWEDSRLGRLGLIDAAALHELCTRPLPPELELGGARPDRGLRAVAALAGTRRPCQAEEEDMTLKLREGVSAADTDYGITLLDEDSGQYWNLNPTGALVAADAAGRRHHGPGGAGATEQYAVDAETASRDVEDLVGELRSAGLVQEQADVTMSMPEAVFYQPRSVPLPRRIVTYLAVGAARLLATRSPRRIRTVLGWLRRGAGQPPSTQAKAARDTVVAVSLVCAAREGCLARSLATVLLCRLRGQWPTWCVGARRLPPFAAHAWVEADGIMVGEDYPPDYFRTLFTRALPWPRRPTPPAATRRPTPCRAGAPPAARLAAAARPHQPPPLDAARRRAPRLPRRAGQPSPSRWSPSWSSTPSASAAPCSARSRCSPGWPSAAALLSAAGTYLLGRAAESVVLTARERLVSQLLRLRVGALDRLKPGDLLSRVTSDTTLLRSVSTYGLVHSVNATFLLVGLDRADGHAGPGAAGGDAGRARPERRVAVLVVVPRIRRATERSQAAVGGMGSVLERALGALPDGQGQRRRGAGDRQPSATAARRAWRRGVEVAGWTALMEASAGLAVQVSFLAVLGVGGTRVASGALPVSSLIAFLLYLFLLTDPISALVNGVTQLQAGLAAVVRHAGAAGAAHRSRRHAGEHRPGRLGVRSRPSVAFTEVWFRYRRPRGGRGSTATSPSSCRPAG